ncbi:MAG: peptidyl-arginine deiminase, partial [Bacteroidetes bacterium]
MKHFYLLIFSFIVLASSVFAQNKKDFSRLHYLSKEEMNQPVNTKLDFNPTDPPEGFIRNVAEFDQMQAVMVRYPFGIPVSLIAEMAQDTRVLTIVANQQQKQSVLTMYVSNNVDTSQCDFVFAQTDSYWTRDYGPFFIFDGNNNAGIVNFPYNRPRPNDDNIPVVIAQYLGINLFGMDLSHTGGNYMCNGMGQAASTDLVLDENPSLTEADVDTLAENYLGIEQYHITLDPLGEYIKHIDCWGKFLAPDKIIIGKVPSADPRYNDFEAVATYFSNQISSYGDHYKVFRVFTPGTPQETPYTNSLILNKKVLVPITGSPWDDDALSAYREAMPGYEVKGIYYSGWYDTDALHCRTKGIADINQLYIWHVPVLGNVDFDYSYPISANLYNYSGQPVYQDSVFIIYQINQGSFDTLLMSPEADNPMG